MTKEGGRAYRAALAQPLFLYSKEDMVDSLKPLGANKKDNDKLVSLVLAYKDEDQDVDWQQVAEDLSSQQPKAKAKKHSALECFSVYHNSLDPEINKAKWTADEEKKLAELAQKYAEHDWIVIAEKLGTGRTPFQCLKHYQQTLCTKFTTVAEWSPDEEILLRQAVLRHGDKNWQRVSSDVPGRTAFQCTVKWRKSAGVFEDGIVNGDWNEEEERRLVLGVVAHEMPCLNDYKLPAAEIQRFVTARVGAAAREQAGDEPIAGGEGGGGTEAMTGKRRKYVKTKVSSTETADGAALPPPSWGRVAEVVPGRDDTRCRDKWTCSMDPTISNGPFSDEENALILALVSKFGTSSWVTISRYLKGRTDNQISSQWIKLTKKTDKSKLQDRKTQGRKHKATLPPKFGRSEGVAALQGGDFTEVLEVEL